MQSSLNFAQPSDQINQPPQGIINCSEEECMIAWTCTHCAHIGWSIFISGQLHHSRSLITSFILLSIKRSPFTSPFCYFLSLIEAIVILASLQHNNSNPMWTRWTSPECWGWINSAHTETSALGFFLLTRPNESWDCVTAQWCHALSNFSPAPMEVVSGPPSASPEIYLCHQIHWSLLSVDQHHIFMQMVKCSNRCTRIVLGKIFHTPLRGGSSRGTDSWDGAECVTRSLWSVFPSGPQLFI